MKPADIYALPTKHAYTLYSADDLIIEDLFGLSDVEDLEIEADERTTCPFMVLEKLYLAVDSATWTSVLAVEFEGAPFAVVTLLKTDSCGTDTDIAVTDEDAYNEALAYVLSRMPRKLEQPSVVDPEDDVELRLDGAVIATFGDETRLVHAHHIGYHTAVPVFDAEKLGKSFDSRIGVHLASGEYADGLKSETVSKIAAEIVMDAVIAERKLPIGGWATDKRWLGGFFLADGEVYAAVAASHNLHKASFWWHRELDVERICVGRYFDLIESYVTNGKVDSTDPLLDEYAAAFGLSRTEAESAVTLVAQGRGDDLLSAAVKKIRLRDEVPSEFEIDTLYIHARLLALSPELVRFGFGDMAGIEYARKLWANYEKRRELDNAASERSVGQPR